MIEYAPSECRVLLEKRLTNKLTEEEFHLELAHYTLHQEWEKELKPKNEPDVPEAFKQSIYSC